MLLPRAFFIDAIVIPGAIDIITLLAQLLDEFYPVFENNEMDYEYHPDASNFVIQGDATLLVRLFDNLINNAIK